LGHLRQILKREIELREIVIDHFGFLITILFDYFAQGDKIKTFHTLNSFLIDIYPFLANDILRSAVEEGEDVVC
jgi:hypothetical protein